MVWLPAGVRGLFAFSVLNLSPVSALSPAAAPESLLQGRAEELQLGSCRGAGECGSEAPCAFNEEADCSLQLLQRRARRAHGAAGAAAPAAPLQTGYKHVVLASDQINATLFLPPDSSSPESPRYYRSTRFDWGSMVGDVLFQKRRIMGSDFWKAPHNPEDPEAVVGIASEFGCAADGATCGAGWGRWKGGSVNGVLGYDEARPGEPFLKIGVGKLVKGSCADCKSGDDTYRFNSKYDFAEWPEWHVSRHGNKTVVLTQTAALESNWGYRLQHRIQVVRRTLTFETLLENTGTRRFRTPWYSHNALNVDDKPTGPPWDIEFPFGVHRYESPSWSSAVTKWFHTSYDILRATADIPNGTKVKMSFSVSSHQSQQTVRGTFSARYQGLHITSRILGAPRPLYKYVLYADRRTLSPVPFIMIDLEPGGYKVWRQVLTFR